MERHEVARGQQLVERHVRRAERLRSTASGGSAASWYRTRIPKPVRPARDGLADPPEADDPERRAVDVGAQQQHRAPRPPAARRGRSGRPRAARRAAAISSAQARSAVVSVRTPGVLPTGIPRRVQAATSMLSKPTAKLLTTFSRGPAASSNSSSTRSVSRVRIPSQPATRRSSSSRGGGSSSSQTSASQAAADRRQALVGDHAGRRRRAGRAGGSRSAAPRAPLDERPDPRRAPRSGSPASSRS